MFCLSQHEYEYLEETYTHRRDRNKDRNYDYDERRSKIFTEQFDGMRQGRILIKRKQRRILRLCHYFLHTHRNSSAGKIQIFAIPSLSGDERDKVVCMCAWGKE